MSDTSEKARPKFKVFDTAFTDGDLSKTLSGMTANFGYSYNKRNDATVEGIRLHPGGGVLRDGMHAGQEAPVRQGVDGMMVLSAIGEIVQGCWDAIPDHMPMAICDAFVVMPDHVHGIIVIREVAADRSDVTGGEFAATTDPSEPPPIQESDQSRPPIAIMVKDSLGHIMQTFKAAVSRKAIRDGLMPRGIPIWQRNYYEHIIRNHEAWARIAKYIQDNPKNWR